MRRRLEKDLVVVLVLIGTVGLIGLGQPTVVAGAAKDDPGLRYEIGRSDHELHDFRDGDSGR